MDLIQTVLRGHILSQGVPPSPSSPLVSLPGTCRGSADAVRLDE